MRERVERFFVDFGKAVKNLETAIDTAIDELDMDGTIKRFELCYELSWKLIKEYLADKGVIVKNPRDCFKEAFANDLIHTEDVWVKMLEDRNYLVHTYTFEESRKIFEHIKDSYLAEFKHLYRIVDQSGIR